MIPITKYGNNFPIWISSLPTGVEISCSIVPRSHSRAIVSEVRNAPTTAITIATTPGTKFAMLSRSSLNQVRGWKVTLGAPTARPRSCCQAICISEE